MPGKRDSGKASPKKPKPKKTTPVLKNSLGGVDNPAGIRAPKRPPRRKTTVERKVEKDTSRRADTRDAPKLLDDYGFLGANFVQQERVRRSVARQAAIQGRNTRLGAYTPLPGFRERAAEALGSLFWGGGDQGPRPISSPVDRVDNPTIRAGIAGSETAVRPANVWLYSLAEAATNPGVALGDVREFATGSAQAIGALAAAAQQRDPEILAKMAEGMAADYRRRYGKNWRDEAKKDPLFNLLDAATVGSGAARVVGIARDAPTIGVKRAVRASFNPAREGRFRSVTDELGQTQEFLYGGGPVMRAVQDAYDAVSQRLPGQIGGDNFSVPVPGSAARRVARQQVKLTRRQLRRDQARLTPYVDFVSNPATRFDLTPGDRAANVVARIRLFWESQLPASMRNNEGLVVLRDALHEERRKAIRDAEVPSPKRTDRAAVAGSLEMSDVPDAPATIASPETLRKISLLTERIAELDAAIKWTPTDRYVQALDAMDEITEITESVILRGVKEAWENTRDPAGPPGPPIMERVTGDAAVPAQRVAFAGRRNRLAEWLDPATQEQVGAFVPHKRMTPETSGISGGFNPRTGTVVTPSDSSRLNLEKYNSLALVKSGEIAPDPELLVRHANAAVGLSMMDEVREVLWNVGQDVPMGSPLPQHGYLVRERTAPVPDKYFNGLAVDDAKVVESAMDGYRRETIVKGDISPGELVETGWARVAENGDIVANTEGVRWVPDSAVERLVSFLGGADARRIRGRASKAGQTVDFAENLAKIAILYTNPGYYAANLLGNMVFLGLQSDPVRGVRSLIDAARLHKSDPDLWRWITMEVGEGPAAALLADTSGTGMLGAGLAAQQKVAVAAGVADRGPRVAAWIQEARSNGYRTRAQWKALRDSDSPEAVRTKNMIQQRATEAMVDFDQMTPFEKTYLRRLIFVYPWLRGASAWAAKFVANKPGKAALVGAAGQAASEMSDKNLGEPVSLTLPASLQGAFVTGRDGNIARVVNATSVNPLGTLNSLISTVTGATKYDTPWDLVHPLIQSSVRGARGENQYGQDIGVGAALKQEGLNLVPGYRQGEYLVDPDASSKMYTDRSRLDVLKRRGLRLSEYGVDVTRAKRARERETAEKPPGTVATRAYDAWKAKAERFAREVGLPEIPATVRLAANTKVEYAAAQEELKSQLGTEAIGGDNADEARADVASGKRRGFLKIAIVENHLPDLGVDYELVSVLRNVLKQATDIEVIDDINSDLDEILGWNDLESWNRDVAELEAAARSGP